MLFNFIFVHNAACEKIRPASYALRAICASPPLTRHGAAGRRPVTGRSLAALSAKKREKRPFKASMSANAPKMDILLRRLYTVKTIAISPLTFSVLFNNV